MHHDVLALLDAHLAVLQTAREHLAAARRVAPGERQSTVLRTLAASERYVAAVRDILAEPNPDTYRDVAASTSISV